MTELCDSIEAAVLIARDRINNRIEEQWLSFKDAIESVLSETWKYSIPKKTHKLIRKRMEKFCYVWKLQKNSYISWIWSNISDQIDPQLLTNKSITFLTIKC